MLCWASLKKNACATVERMDRATWAPRMTPGPRGRHTRNQLLRPCAGRRPFLLLCACGVLAILFLLVRPTPRPMADATVLRNENGVEVHIISTGAIITKLLAPDKDGNLADIVLGFDTEEPYKNGTSPYMGAVVGRVANRIANATFELDGVRYQLFPNNGPNTLHGGKVGFDKVTWTVQRLDSAAGEAVRLAYRSKDGEEGFPGNLDVAVTYTLTPANELITVIAASTDAATPVNLAQHSYFNLGGHASGDILAHQLTIHGPHMTPVTEALIPTGEIVPVEGTPFDFTRPHAVGERIASVPGGYDHNFVLFGLGPDAKEKVKHGMASEEPQLAATLYDPQSGRGMDVLTTAPGVQFYSGNFLDGSLRGKGGASYPKHGGLCLETQGFPDSINQPAFPSVVLRPDEGYRHHLVYRFFTRPA